MSTRCNIEIYDYDLPDTCNAMLYHHSDGYPEFMRPKLERFLKAAYKKIKDTGHAYWWDAERVAAAMILLSVEDYEEPMEPGRKSDPDPFPVAPIPLGPAAAQRGRPDNGIPAFLPCVRRHGDIAFIWKVYLKKDGAFEIRCEPTRRD
jgi:hypothetical protein